MFYVLHIPTATILYNPILNEYWHFKYKKVIDQLLDINCPVNIFSDIIWLGNANPQIDWKNITLDEFEIVEIK